MKITDSRAHNLLRWLDGMAADHTLLFEEMTLFRDTAALIRQLQAAEQAAWYAGLDDGREQGRGKDHPSPSAPVRVSWADLWIAQGDWTTANDYAAFKKAEQWLLAQHPAAVEVDANELAGVRARLKSGDYDGVDIMRAWLAIDKLLALRERLGEGAEP